MGRHAFTISDVFSLRNHGTVLVIEEHASAANPVAGMRVELLYPDGSSSANVIAAVHPFNKGRMGPGPIALGVTLTQPVASVARGSLLLLAP